MKNKVTVFLVLALLIALPLGFARALVPQSSAIEAKPADVQTAPVGAPSTQPIRADTQPTPLLKKSNRNNRNDQGATSVRDTEATSVRDQLCKGDYDRLGNGKIGNGVVNAHDIDGFIRSYSRFEGKPGRRIGDRASLVGTIRDKLFWITDIDDNGQVNKEDLKGFINLLFNEEKPLCIEY